MIKVVCLGTQPGLGKLYCEIRIAIAEAGVRRCFARRHEGRYAFMPYEDAVRHCRKWIAALRDMRMEK